MNKILKIYLDNCCFNRPFDDQKQIKIRLQAEAKLFIQEKIIRNELKLVWSYILDYENHYNPFKERKNSIEQWKNSAIIDIEETEEVLNIADKLVKLSLKSKDALHLACAIIAKCDYFLTTDDLITKKLTNFKEIRVINPVNFLMEIEE
jgi:predicted nucleic acid-binding protein